MCTPTKLTLIVQRQHWQKIDCLAQKYLPGIEVSYLEPNSFQKQHLPRTIILGPDGTHIKDLPTAFVVTLQKIGFAFYLDKLL